MTRAFRAALWLILPSAIGCAPNQRTATLGDLHLESGDVLYDCHVGYRTLGRLNPTRSNAVLVLPWFQGTSSQLAYQVGLEEQLDTSKNFVVVVDALANGVSSSPSNSTRQPGGAFPRITMGDIVESQLRLVTTTLGLRHLKAVVGISMGGMQVFQWIVAHPDFMDKAVAIVGSPQSQPDDQRRWQAYTRDLHDDPRWKKAARALRRAAPRTFVNELLTNVYDHTRQAEAIMKMDVASRSGGSLPAVAAAVRADLLVVGTWKDEEVNPKPAFDFARLRNAQVLELDGRCGHQAPSCERGVLWPAVEGFLAR